MAPRGGVSSSRTGRRKSLSEARAHRPSTPSPPLPLIASGRRNLATWARGRCRAGGGARGGAGPDRSPMGGTSKGLATPGPRDLVHAQSRASGKRPVGHPDYIPAVRRAGARLIRKAGRGDGADTLRAVVWQDHPNSSTAPFSAAGMGVLRAGPHTRSGSGV